MGEILKKLEFFLKYGFITIPFILWILWAVYHWRIFNNKSGEQYDDASIRRLNWLKQDRWSGLYISWLGALLDKVSAVIGDAGQGRENRVSRLICNRFGFDHNPWTEPSFNLLFRIALVYPLLSFIVFWLMGGSGNIEDIKFLPDNTALSESQRWGIGIVLFGYLSVLIYWIRWLRTLSGWPAIVSLSVIVFLFLLIGLRGDIDRVILNLFFIFLVALLIVLPGGIAGYGVSWLFLRNQKDSITQVRTTMWDIVIAGTTALLFSVVIAGTVASTGDSAVAVTIAVAFAGAYVFTGAYAAAITTAVASTVEGATISYAQSISVSASVSVAIFYQNILIRGQASWFWLIYLGLGLWLGFWAIQNISSDDSVLYLFWLIFPLLNVPLDWLSLGVTRGLLQSIRSGQHTGTRGFIWALADLGIAFVLLFLMAAILLTAVQFANDLRLAVGKDMVLDLVALLQNMEKDPANPDFYWIYFMLFSTLIPTLVHFSLAGASVLLWFPAKTRHALVKKWHNDADKKLEIWFYVSVMPVLGFVIAPAVLLYTLWLLLSSFGFGIALINFFQYFVGS